MKWGQVDPTPRKNYYQKPQPYQGQQQQIALFLPYNNDEEHVMHSKSGNIDIMINDEADEVINKLFVSLKNRYQKNLEQMKWW